MSKITNFPGTLSPVVELRAGQVLRADRVPGGQGAQQRPAVVAVQAQDEPQAPGHVLGDRAAVQAAAGGVIGRSGVSADDGGRGRPCPRGCRRSASASAASQLGVGEDVEGVGAHCVEHPLGHGSGGIPPSTMSWIGAAHLRRRRRRRVRAPRPGGCGRTRRSGSARSPGQSTETPTPETPARLQVLEERLGDGDDRLLGGVVGAEERGGREAGDRRRVDARGPRPAR